MFAEQFFDKLAVEGIILGATGIKTLSISAEGQRVKRTKVEPVFLFTEHLEERAAILLKTNYDTALGAGQFFEFFQPGADRNRISSNLERLISAICPAALRDVVFFIGPIDADAPHVF